MKNTGPTQRDVARLAGVSRAVVSYVINNRSGGNVRISDETRQRVMAAVRDLGYQPNVLARSLRTRRTQLLSVLVPDIANPFYPLLIRGAQAVAEPQDYHILVYDSHDSPQRERAFVDAMLRRRVDGVIMVAFHLESPDVDRLLASGIRTVAVGGRLRTAAIDVVATRERLAVRDIMHHLLRGGHRRIAHLAGRLDTPPGQVRFQGYRQALQQAGIPFDEALVRYGTFEPEGVADLVASLFAVPRPADGPSALFAANDVMAIEAMRALSRLGYRVPQDVAVCGFDNIPQAAAVTPALTTVGQDMQAMGRIATEMLLQRLAGADVPSARHVSVPHQLLVRESA